MEVNIRSMRLQDIPEVLRIEKNSFSTPWSYWIFFQELISPERYYIVAEIQGNLVGYAGMHWVIDEGHITNIAVKPSFRRKGIGSELLAHLIRKAQEKKLKFLTLEVRESNTAAINLYKKFGFKIEGVRKNYYINPTENGIIMTLYL